MKKTAVLFFLSFYALFFFLLLPGYKYIIDPDATGYIKIAERVAAGDYARSVNGLWSPLNAWLLVPFLKAGVNAVMAAKYLNGIFSCCSIISVFFLLKKFVLHRYAEFGIMISVSILLLHCTFNELFADLLLVLLLLIYLNVICSKNFIKNNFKIIACGLICAIGFYAKAYFLYFAVVHLAITFYILVKTTDKFNWRKWIISTSLAVVVLFACAIPWGFELKSKYEKGFTFSTAGKFNQTWVLSAAYPQPAQLLEPPHYEDGCSFWDDPSYWKVKNITPFTNKKVFLFQLRILVSNTLDTIQVLNDFSFVAIAILLITFLMAITGSKNFIAQKNNLLLFALLCIFPIGYIILHVEARFFWIIDIALILLAGILLTLAQQSGYLKFRLFTISCLLVFGSFCIYPINQLQNQYKEGKDAFDMADAFRKNNISGKVVANVTNMDESARSLQVCYLLKSQLYGTSNLNYSESELLNAIHSYKIDHYIVYYHFPWQKEQLLHSTLATNATSVRDDIYPGVIVLSYKRL